MTGLGEIWQWAVLWNVVALLLVFQPTFERIEFVFKILLAMLAVSFLGTALWVGPNLTEVLRGLVSVQLPPSSGRFEPLLVAVAMIGTVGGSLMNLVYPYFLEAKGWRGPQYRRVQFYDFLLAMLVMIVLNLSVWILGAELLYPKGLTISELDDLPRLLSEVLGRGGHVLFYLGVFAAIYTSIIGHALGLAYMGSHAYVLWRAKPGQAKVDYKKIPLYRAIVVWCLVSPLIWAAPGMPGFVALTLVVNAAQVVLLPLIAGGLWIITSRAKFIGAEYRNRLWEHVVMSILFVLAVWGAYKSVETVFKSIRDLG